MKKLIIILIVLSSFLIAKEFELKNQIESYTHIDYIANVNELRFRCDLGNMELNENDSLIFVSKYGNAVINKSDVIDFTEPITEGWK